MSEFQEDNRPAPAEGNASNLTDWAKEPSLLSIKGEFDQARSAHDAQMLRIKKWNDLMAVQGKAKPKKVEGRSSVQPKLIRRQAEWRYSALTEPFLGSSKLYKISPVTYEDARSARQNELLLNWQFRTKMNRIKFIDDYVRSTVDEGTCIVRVGWKRVTVKVKEEAPVYGYYAIQTEEQLQALQQAMELKQTDPAAFQTQLEEVQRKAVEYYEESGQPVFAQVERTEEVEVEKVLENRPELRIFDPRNVRIDPSCEGDIERAQFCVFSIETNQAELVAENRYKNLDKVNWEDAAPVQDTEHATKTPDDFQFADAARKKVIMHEYWGFYDISGTNRLEPIVVSWIGNTIVRMERNPFPDQKLPLVVVPYLPIKRELYGEPDAELLEDNQAILGAVSRGMIDLLGRSANSQQGFAKGMLDALNKRRFENGQDYEFNPNIRPDMGHIMHKYPELPQSALLMVNMQNQEAEALSGVKSFSGGLSGQAYGDVAAGIRGVLDAASKREMAILRRLAKGMVDIGRKIISMNKAFLSDEEVIRVTNEEFVTVRREELAGDVDLEVDISTAEVDNAQVQDLGFVLQTMGPDMDFSMKQMVLAEICRLKKLYELEHQIKAYKPEPDPLVQRQRELEIALLEKQIEELDSKIQKNMAEAEAKRSEKDLKDLDFVEQETGTKHARDLQKQQAQARGNQDLQITKALTSERDPTKIGPNVEAAVGFNELTDQREMGAPQIGPDGF